MSTTLQATKVLYTAQTHTVGNRENGVSRSSDGNLEVRLAVPGTGRPGTNPEQLFAAGWSACFDGALGIAAGKSRVDLPAERSIDAEVDLALEGSSFFLQARLNIHLPGLDRSVAHSLVKAARNICPYSKAIQGNVNVEYNLI
ncbi:MAG TPA: organic hydroperoxide resistance protein [Puia sp.]|nr:organic hydroperoxide resistance protein [Puia sp.]